MTNPTDKIHRGIWDAERGHWVDHPDLNNDQPENSPYATPKGTCPFCGFVCEPEYVDIGVGYQQVTPMGCECCWAVEVGSFDKDDRPRKFGWYLPMTPEDLAAWQGRAPATEPEIIDGGFDLEKACRPAGCGPRSEKP